MWWEANPWVQLWVFLIWDVKQVETPAGKWTFLSLSPGSTCVNCRQPSGNKVVVILLRGNCAARGGQGLRKANTGQGRAVSMLSACLPQPWLTEVCDQ